ncbi:hypothetical protein LIER_15153 [Lithospermum erythrorhizon]|uniref:ARID domain-containing protein n=1 Tax=Lithospermum erythrorhizon TaxID=34254 RepID=A0AAV3Q3D1_LITER
MFHVQGAPKQTCSLLAVLSGCNAEDKPPKQEVAEGKPHYPFPEIESAGRLEVQVLKRPSINELRRILDSLQPDVVFFQGEQLPGDETGSLVRDDVNLSSVEAVSELFATVSPTTVYLELTNGQKLAEALQAKGVPYVIYWQNTMSCYAACHFRHALFSVMQSSPCHTWDAFQLAYASFSLYCFRNDPAVPDNLEKISIKVGPQLLGEPPKINVPPPEIVPGDDEENQPEDLPAIKIYDDYVNGKFLICGTGKTLDTCSLRSLEDGLNALLNIEMRGSKLHNRVSAFPPPLQAGTFSRNVVTMRCDISTSSSSHISLLLSGSAQTCFDDQLLEDHIKSEIIDKSLLTHALVESEAEKVPASEPRRSVSIACGTPVFEVSLKIPTWGSQVLRQLAPDTSYRSLVVLGIAGVQGLAVSAFEKNDTERLLFFSSSQGKENNLTNFQSCDVPSWLRPPAPRRPHSCQEIKAGSQSGLVLESQVFIKKEREDGEMSLQNEVNMSTAHARRKPRAAALRPIPHIQHRKMLPFSGISDIDPNNVSVVKPSVPVAPSTKYNGAAAPLKHRKSVSASFQTKHVVSLNPLPLKKHDCNRSPIHVCSEEEFLKDLMQFLIIRGHTRLVPQGGLAEFPDAILNAKRLDLLNLYREVVSRGGFYVGNGINWKGQVFSKMRNHTATNKMTGVGNTLKRHYETYLLEYELAHDDVDGEFCLLCHSSAAGDWVNCGTCGEWAHFGCDRRQGLGAFKDYAKTDGLEYICPQCSVSNYKKKMKTTNGFS